MRLEGFRWNAPFRQVISAGCARSPIIGSDPPQLSSITIRPCHTSCYINAHGRSPSGSVPCSLALRLSAWLLQSRVTFSTHGRLSLVTSVQCRRSVTAERRIHGVLGFRINHQWSLSNRLSLIKATFWKTVEIPYLEIINLELSVTGINILNKILKVNNK